MGNIFEWIKDPRDIVVCYGSPGTGKTYFAAAVMAYFLEKTQDIRAYTENFLLGKLRQSMGAYTSSDYIKELHQMIDSHFIIIDDFGAAPHTEWREEVLYELVNFRYVRNLPTIITTNLDESKMKMKYDHRITSRLFSRRNTVVFSGNKNYRQEGK